MSKIMRYMIIDSAFIVAFLSDLVNYKNIYAAPFILVSFYLLYNDNKEYRKETL